MEKQRERNECTFACQGCFFLPWLSNSPYLERRHCSSSSHCFCHEFCLVVVCREQLYEGMNGVWSLSEGGGIYLMCVMFKREDCIGRMCHVTNHGGWAVGCVQLLVSWNILSLDLVLSVCFSLTWCLGKDMETSVLHQYKQPGGVLWVIEHYSRAEPVLILELLLQSLVLFITKPGQEPPTFTGGGCLADIVNDQTTINWLNLVLNSSLCHGSKVCELLNESVYTQRANQITTFKSLAAC